VASFVELTAYRPEWNNNCEIKTF